jgi:two-component system alkaline phosphatase synthesis response regulator PhoP
MGSVSYRLFLVEDDPALVQAIAELAGPRGRFVRGAAPVSMRFGGIRVNFKRAELLRGGEHIGLSERENRLLQFLVFHRHTTVSREALLEHVWGYPHAPLTRTVDVTILRLRQKIERDPRNPRFIVTVPGLGYRFDG